MRGKTQKKNRSIPAAFCLVISLAVVFILTSRGYSDLVIDTCFQRLEGSAAQLTREIRADVREDTKRLSRAAALLAGCGPFDHGGNAVMAEILKTFGSGNLFVRMELLLPDGRFLLPDETVIAAPAGLSYEKEAAKGTHLSDRIGDAKREGKQTVYHIVPVVLDGETLALLCGVIDLGRWQERCAEIMEEGNSRIYLMEAKSGNFLMDVTHETLGNVKDLEGRKVKPGYSREKVVEDIQAGEAGRTAFYSQTAGEYLYGVHEPVGVRDWMLLYSMPESMAFHSVKRVWTIFYLSALAETAIFAAYLTWMFAVSRREARERGEQLNRVRYMLAVEKTLFNAPREPELIEEALGKVGQMHDAQGAFLITSVPVGQKKTWLWRRKDCAVPDAALDGAFPVLQRQFEKERRTILDSREAFLKKSEEEYRLLQTYGVKSLMVIQLLDSTERHIGVLGVVNTEKRHKDTELLDCVMFSFSMAVGNRETFLRIQEMGTRDDLTGLNNRNLFHSAIEEMEKEEDDSLFCVYMDADGLHEINNQYGHVAGDRLLQTVAMILREEFGQENTYRIGGDEFVAFCRETQEERLLRRIESVRQKVKDQGYHISIGVEARRRAPLLYELVKQAEKEMYEEKRRYYDHKEDGFQVREMNRQLEKTLTEKRDLDLFRSLLASKYKGVYIVELGLDTMRYIYIPPYFEEAVRRAGGKFSRALRYYMEENVQPQFYSEFDRLLNYPELAGRLDQGEEPELSYQKLDGSYVFLRIYRSLDYTQNRRECVWFFETV